MKMIQRLTDCRVTVMGLGRFGGGVGVTRWLCEAAGARRVIVTDLECDESRLRDSIDAIQDLIDRGSVVLRLGEHRESDFTQAETDLVIANPAVPRPWTNRYLNAARESGVPLTTEIRLLVERLPPLMSRAHIIGITGSAGKSTTAAMIHHALRSLGYAAHLGGNIGGTLLARDIQPGDRVVLELSSAMLYWLGAGVGYSDARGWSPGIAVITNITPNHLDWHGSFEHYVESKLNIARELANDAPRDGAMTQDRIENRSAEALIIGAGVRDVMSRAGFQTTRSILDALSPPAALVNRARDSDVVPPLLIPGEHNRWNAAIAIRAVAASLAGGGAQTGDVRGDGVSLRDLETIGAALRTFTGLPHRLQLVAACKADGVRFYNDSKSTTPEATTLAIAAFPESRRIHLIAGGFDKGINLSAIARLAPRLAGLYTIGAVGERLAADAADALAAHASETGANGATSGAVAQRSPVAEFHQTLGRAIERIFTRLQAGDIVLLSPGCASWDQYTNFEARGDEFARLIRERIG